MDRDETMSRRIGASSLVFGLALAALLSGCDEGDGPARPDDGDAGSQVCERGVLEPDLGDPVGPGWNLRGPGVDPATGQLRPLDGPVTVSTTYLRLQNTPTSQQAFGALVGAITADLETRPGLLAVALATSESCGTARTLTVWESEAAMLDFVVGDAHIQAVRDVGMVSRGGSVVTSWVASSAERATQAEAARQLDGYTGPEY